MRRTLEINCKCNGEQDLVWDAQSKCYRCKACGMGESKFDPKEVEAAARQVVSAIDRAGGSSLITIPPKPVELLVKVAEYYHYGAI